MIRMDWFLTNFNKSFVKYRKIISYWNHHHSSFNSRWFITIFYDNLNPLLRSLSWLSSSSWSEYKSDQLQQVLQETAELLIFNHSTVILSTTPIISSWDLNKLFASLPKWVNFWKSFKWGERSFASTQLIKPYIFWKLSTIHWSLIFF